MADIMDDYASSAFDDAIADRVNVISVSLGSEEPREYFKDPIAIGSFHAMRKGILTSNSAETYLDHFEGSLNFSPWSLTMAARTIDRKFVSQVVLGNGQIFTRRIGVVMADIMDDYASSFPLPTTLISIEDGIKALDYIRTTE
ncbi:hypothetical protein IFM89_023714 [Coptis chinensis]|uniref:Uncharacterized protein n=1 Tax=Coptis chinensis TaxID=261450 RepID=A0A835LJL3_9MAGN|nr:hypothetical protein IFM89_023714 [Coptis chinensis]